MPKRDRSQRPPSPESGCTWHAASSAGGHSIEKILRDRFPRWSRDHVAKLLRQQRVLCNGDPAQRGACMSGGERIEIIPAVARAPIYLPNRRVHVNLVHSDACIAVVAKPPGLAVHPGPGHGSHTLINGMLALYRDELEEMAGRRRWGMVHRLDADTSGVILFARSPSAYDSLRNQFYRRVVGKTYLALLAGSPERDSYEVDEPVGGQPSSSRLAIVERFAGCALAHVQPITGRRHQIRCHAAFLGHPVVGDQTYGPRLQPEHPMRRLGLSRMFLHAAALSIYHPATLERVSYSADVPRDLRRALARLRRDEGASERADPKADSAARSRPSSP